MSANEESFSCADCRFVEKTKEMDPEVSESEYYYTFWCRYHGMPVYEPREKSCRQGKKKEE